MEETRRQKRRRRLSLLIIWTMVMQLCAPASYGAVTYRTAETRKIITGFSDLPESVKNINIPLGADDDAVKKLLEFPETVEATVMEEDLTATASDATASDAATATGSDAVKASDSNTYVADEEVDETADGVLVNDIEVVMDVPVTWKLDVDKSAGDTIQTGIAPEDYFTDFDEDGEAIETDRETWMDYFKKNQEFNGKKYTYVAELPEGYQLADGVKLPEIIVTVGMEEMNTLAEEYVATVLVDGETTPTNCTTLTDALEKAKGKTATITLLSDITGSGFTVTEGSTVTLNLNKFNITYDGEHNAAVVNQGTLILEGSGSIDGVGKDGIYYCGIENGGTLTLNGGTIKNFYSGVSNRSDKAATLTVNKDVFITGNIEKGIDNGTDATCIVNGGSITNNVSATSLGIRNDGTLTINGGEFSGSDKDVYTDAKATTLNGGTFGCIEVYGEGKTVGGLLGTDCVYQDTDTKAYITDTTTLGKFIISKVTVTGAPVASVTHTEGSTTTINSYATFDEAKDNAKDGDTITLLKDAKTGYWSISGKTLTLELNGKTLTRTDENTYKVMIDVLSSGGLIVKDSTGTEAFPGKITDADYYTIQVQDGTFTLESGTIENTKVGGYALVVFTATTNINLSGGTFKATGDAGCSIYMDKEGDTVASLLANGCCYYKGDTAGGEILDASEVTELTETVTVGAAPVASVSIDGGEPINCTTLTDAFTKTNDTTATATIKLLADAEATAALTVTAGSNITLDLGTYTITHNGNFMNTILNNGILTVQGTTGRITQGSSTSGPHAIGNNGKLTFKSGTITGFATGIVNGDRDEITGENTMTGELTMTGGTITKCNVLGIYNNKSSITIVSGGSITENGKYAMHVGGIYNAGTLTVNGGEISGVAGVERVNAVYIADGGTATLNGGTFGKITAETGTMKALLGKNCIYKNTATGTYVTDGEILGSSTISNVTVAAIPVQITGQPESAEKTYGYTDTDAPKLSVTAVKATGVTADITYQWYKDSVASGNVITGATGAEYTIPTGLDVGVYTYICAVTCDGYTINTSSATFTVKQDKGRITDHNKYNKTPVYTGSALDDPKTDDFTTDAGDLSYSWYSGNPVADDAKPLTTNPTNVGTYTLRVTAADSTNFSAPDPMDVKVDIIAATPTISWGSNSKQTVTYDGNEVSITAPAVTLVNNETYNGTIRYAYKSIGGLTRGLFADYTDGLPTDAGIYSIKAHIDAAGNYTAADSGDMTLTVEQSTTGIALQNYAPGRAYTGMALENPSKDELTITGADYNDVTFTWYQDSVDTANKLKANPANQGTYVLVADIAETKNTKAASVTSGAINISRVNATITATGQTITYGQEILKTTAEVTAEGLVNGETITGITLEASTTNVTDGGTITPSQAVVSGNGAGNYEISYQTGTLIINRADPAFTIPTGLTAVYGQTLNDVTLPTGIVNGVWNWKNSTTSVGNVGSHDFIAVFTPKDAVNYNSKEVTVSVTVAQAAPTVAFTSDTQSMEYTGSTAKITAPVVTGVKGEIPDGSISYAYKKDAAGLASIFSLFDGYTDGLPTEAGSYHIKAQIAAKGNYSQADSSNELKLTITPAAVKLTAPEVNTNITYSGAAQKLITAGSVTGGTLEYKLGDGDWVTAVPEAVNAGTYTVAYRVVGDGNHTSIGETSLSVTIAPKTTTPAVTVNGTYVYTGKQIKPEDIVVKDGTSVIDISDYDVSYGANINAGKGSINIILKNNYRGSGNGEFVIGKATPALTMQGSMKKDYDGSADVTIAKDSTNGYSFSLEETPVFTFYTDSTCETKTGTTDTLGGAAAEGVAPKNAGIYYVKASYDGTDNYNAVTSEGTLTYTIIAESVNITAKNQTIVYKGEVYDVSSLFTIDENAGDVSYAVVSGGTGDGTLSGSVLTISKAGTITIKTVTEAQGNYAAGEATAVLTVTLGTGNGTVSLGDWIYGETAAKPVVTSGTNGTDHVDYLYKKSVDADSTYTSTVPEDAGNYIVKAVFAATDLYDTVTATDTFTIGKAEAPAITYPTASEIYSDQKLSASALTGGSTEYGAFAWTDDSIVPTVGNNGYTVTFTPNEATVKNYEAFEVTQLTGTVAVHVVERPQENDTKTDVAVAKPEVEDAPAGASEEVKDIVEALRNPDTAPKAEGLDKAAEGVISTDESGQVTVQAGNTVVTGTQAVEALEKENISTAGKETKLVVEPYIQVKVQDIVTEGDKTVLVMDIKALYNVKATTASSTDDMVEHVNTVTIGTGYQQEISEPVTISIPLPKSFGKENLFVRHTHDGIVSYYEVTVEGDMATFVNKHGFSKFELLSDTQTGTLVFDSGVADVTYNLANVGDELPVAVKDGYTFQGWNINGTIYTTFTLDLLELLNGTDGKKMEVTAVFTKNSSGSGSGSSGGSSGGSGNSDSASHASGWSNEGTKGWRYYDANGTYARNAWRQVNENGVMVWYHFGADGYMNTGWFLDTDGSWYYLNPVSDGTKGAMKSGWLTDALDGHRYYLDPKSGKMAVGWVLIDGVWYYFNDVAPAASGWYFDQTKNLWAYDPKAQTPLGALVEGAEK